MNTAMPGNSRSHLVIGLGRRLAGLDHPNLGVLLQIARRMQPMLGELVVILAHIVTPIPQIDKKQVTLGHICPAAKLVYW
jgi:hypothetical protein